MAIAPEWFALRQRNRERSYRRDRILMAAMLALYLAGGTAMTLAALGAL